MARPPGADALPAASLPHPLRNMHSSDFLLRALRRCPLPLVAALACVVGATRAESQARSVEEWDRAFSSDRQVYDPRFASKVFLRYFFPYAREPVINAPFNLAKPVDRERFFRLYVQHGIESIGTPLSAKVVRTQALSASWVGRQYLGSFINQWRQMGVGQSEWPNFLSTVQSLLLNPRVRDVLQPRERLEQLAQLLMLYQGLDCSSRESGPASPAVVPGWVQLIGEYEALHRTHGRPSDVDPSVFSNFRRACVEQAG